MLNEALYDVLIELGASQEKAKAASRQNKELELIHEALGNLFRQASETNHRLCKVEEDVSDIKEDVKNLKTKFEAVDSKLDFLTHLVKGLAKLDE